MNKELAKLPYKRIYALIHLDAVRENVERMKANVPEGTKLIGVVKTDAYGHGCVPVAKAIDEYVWGYCVATCEEGEILREHHIGKPVIILGNVSSEQYAEVVKFNLSAAMFEYDRAKKMSDVALKQGKKAKIHLVVDTGMTRIGFRPDESGLEEAKKIAALPGIEIEGMFTHFAKADEVDPSYTQLQFSRYIRMDEMLEQNGIHIPIKHCANSAATMVFPEYALDACRMGISMYGLYPSDEMSHDMPLSPVMEIKSRIMFIKDVEPGVTISYGGTYKTEKKLRVATVGAGYGDGYPRGNSNKGEVIIRGKRCRILGRVCMDQFMVDVTDVPDVQEEDEVTLVGRDGDEFIGMEEMASVSGGFHYEIPCVLGKRVPKVFLDGKKVVGTKDYNRDLYEDFR